MASNIVDITDTTPNPALIEYLEAMLERAKAGELRSVVFVRGYSDGVWNNGWVIDRRSDRMKMLGAVTLTQHEMLTNQCLADTHSVLSEALDNL
jgi:transposase